MSKTKIIESDLNDLRLFLSENLFAPGIQFKAAENLLVEKSTWFWLEKYALANTVSKVVSDTAAKNIGVDFSVRFACDKEGFHVLCENFLTGEIVTKKTYPEGSIWKYESDELPKDILWCIWTKRDKFDLACLSFELRK